MIEFDRVMHHIEVVKEIIQFCLFDCVYDEYVINVSCVQEVDILNFQVDVRVFKCVHLNGWVWRGCNNANGAPFVCVKCRR